MAELADAPGLGPGGLRPLEVRVLSPGLGAETNVVYAAGLVQGIVLVTFPAASTIFTDPDEYDLSQHPVRRDVPAAGDHRDRRVAARSGAGRAGSAASGCTCCGLWREPGVDGAAARQPRCSSADTRVAYAAAAGRHGVPRRRLRADRPVAQHVRRAFHPDRVDSSVLALNALLGLGTALAPVFVAIFVGLGFWWGLPVLRRCCSRRSSASASRLPLRDRGRRRAGAGRATASRSRFWLFAGFAVLYGICETMNGNWSQLDMTSELGASTTQASLALTAFWAMVTVGRVLFAAIERWLPARRDLPPAAVRARRHVRADRRAARRHAAGSASLAFGLAGPRLLGAAAADDQLRPGATSRRCPPRSPAA